MIIDYLTNDIDKYKAISEDIYEGIVFLKNADADIELGEYVINDRTKAIVTEYETKEVFERGYEVHKRHLDIQYPIRGLERVKWSPVENMEVNIPYDEAKDRTFYKVPTSSNEVITGNGVFAIMFPTDAHSPQLFVGKTELIKKITIKVEI